jgi:hypothetical protein
MIEYRGEIITIMGKGYWWGGVLFPTWEMLTSFIDKYKEQSIPEK